MSNSFLVSLNPNKNSLPEKADSQSYDQNQQIPAVEMGVVGKARDYILT